jgi:hypothetical protein
MFIIASLSEKLEFSGGVNYIARMMADLASLCDSCLIPQLYASA